MKFWAEAKRLSYVTAPDRFRDLLPGLGFELSVSPEEFRDHYRSELCDADGWPRSLPILDGGGVAEGLTVWSLSATIEGRTTGSRSECRANGCPGWFVGILWQTGQQMYLCSEGWHHDDGVLSIIGGGEISARFVSPVPLGVDPAPRSEWPTPRELHRRKGWRVTT